MRRILIIIFSVVLGVTLIALSIPGIVYIKNYFTWGDTYDDKYAVEWISEDEHISFVVTSIKGIQGRGFYNGKYFDNGGTEYEVQVITNGTFDVRISDNTELLILNGIEHMNYYADTLTVNVGEVDADISIYKPGDTIVFKKQK